MSFSFFISSLFFVCRSDSFQCPIWLLCTSVSSKATDKWNNGTKQTQSCSLFFFFFLSAIIFLQYWKKCNECCNKLLFGCVKKNYRFIYGLGKEIRLFTLGQVWPAIESHLFLFIIFFLSNNEPNIYCDDWSFYYHYHYYFHSIQRICI